MNKNIHMPGAAGEWRKGGLERKDAGESLGRHQFTHFRFLCNVYLQNVDFQCPIYCV